MRITAAGSLPGTDFRGALSALTELLPELLPLPELPARGPGSDMVGRAIGLIDGLGFDVQPAGWRLSSHPGRDQRRAAAQWRHDLDDAEELLQGFDGTLKVGVAGPWTLASTIERPMGDRLLADHGARRELAEALAEAVTALRGVLARRLPAATVVVQIDEPALLAVREGQIPTASGFSRHRRIDPPELSAALKPLADGAILHCCAPGRWLEVARSSGFQSVSVDAKLINLDELGQWLDEDRSLVLGVVDTATATVQSVDELIGTTLRILRELQVGDPGAAVALGTACGLAGWQQGDVAPQLRNLRRAADLAAEDLARG